MFAGSNAASGGLGVARVKVVCYIHSFYDSSDRNEWFGVVSRGVVAQVDEDLRGAAIRDGKGEGDCAAGVGYAAGIVGNGLSSPGLGYGRISVDAELSPTVCDDAEKGRVVIITGADEAVETVDAIGRPFTMELNHDRALSGVEADTRYLRGGFRAQKRAGEEGERENPWGETAIRGFVH